MRRYWFLLVLLLALAACGGGTIQNSKGVWDNSKWDQTPWQ